MEVKARPRPIAQIFDEPVRHWIQVDVIPVSCVVVVITNPMFPIPRLPDAATPLATLIPRNRYITPAAGKKALCEPTLDSTPAFGKVIIARRQLPDAVKMIGEEN